MARPKENTERLNLCLPPETMENIKAIAKDRGTTAAGLIRMIVVQWTKRELKRIEAEEQE